MSIWGRLSKAQDAFRRLGPTARVGAIGAGVIALMLAVTAALAVTRYHAELTDAARELRTLDLLLAEETGRSLQNVNLVLDSIADQIAHDGIDTPEAFTELESTVEVQKELHDRVAGIPQLDALTIVGADGKLLNYSRGWPVPDVRLGDRDYIRHLIAHPEETRYLGEPVLSRGSGSPTIYLARRISGTDGRLIGFVLGAIEVGYFERLYASLHLEPSDFVALWRQDGVLLGRYPSAPLGQRTALSDISPDGTSWHGVPGVSEKLWSMEGEPPRQRVVAAEAVTGFPVQINIGRSKDTILADWRHEVLAIGTFVLIAIACVIAMMWALARRFHAYEAVATAARERERAILARQEAEDALRQAQKMEAVGQLTGGVAHDFNNLLTVIGSSVELLRRSPPDADRRARYIDAIADAAARAAKLTAQLLAFARRQTLQPEVFDVNRNVIAISQMIDRLTGPDIEVATDIPDTPCFVDADPNQFDTAIVNMALNGRDAMEQGGRLTITVAVSTALPMTEGAPEPDGAFVAVSVRDTGRGITPEMRDRVFEPFYTTKKVGQGTGLGLSQVIGFAKQSGGEVSVESIVGMGSTFTLHLPRAEEEHGVMRAGSEPAEVPDGSGARILVVDDNPEVGRVGVQMLKELNYFSVLVSNGHDALDILADDADGFAAVLSDVVMPGMDGIALGRLVRTRHPGLPVLLTTGFSAALAESGSDEFPLLQKPYTLATLGRALFNVVVERRDPVDADGATTAPRLFG